MRVTQECAERKNIRLEAVRPEILPQQAACVFDMSYEPRKHELERGRLVKLLINLALRQHKSFVERLRDPWILLVDIAPNHYRVHDGEYFGSLVILPLHGWIVFEKSLHRSRPAYESRWHPRRIKSINLTGIEHPGQSLVSRNRFKTNLRRQRELKFFGTPRFLFSTVEVVDAADRDLEFVAQNSANPHAGSHLVLRRAHALADQVRRFPDAAVAVDVNAR